MVSDELLNKQAMADIRRTNALTEEVEASTAIKKMQVKLMEKELSHK